MPIFQFDAQISIPEPFGLSGRYYWTWITYWSGPTFASISLDARANVENMLLGDSHTDMKYEGYRITSPPRSGTVIQQDLTHPQNGFGWSGNRIPLHNVIRLRHYSQGRQVGYSLFRTGFIESQMLGVEWDSSLLSLVRGKQLISLTNNHRCGLRGELIDNIEAEPLVAMANLRHGTKRRARKVLT